MTRCHTCEQPLGDSVSAFFCGESCQGLWHARQVGADLPFDYLVQAIARQTAAIARHMTRLHDVAPRGSR